MNLRIEHLVIAILIFLLGGVTGWVIKPTDVIETGTVRTMTSDTTTRERMPIQHNELPATVKYVPYIKYINVPGEERVRTVEVRDTVFQVTPFVASVDTILDECNKMTLNFHFPQMTFDVDLQPCPDTTVTTKEQVTETIKVEDTKRFGIGPAASYGYDVFSSTWRATVGIAVTWHVVEW